ncbi:unnamed protein product [Closterium sp. NIES-64]|nr:unnamed protein product [Closterium sp. NIES-64]
MPALLLRPRRTTSRPRRPTSRPRRPTSWPRRPTPAAPPPYVAAPPPYVAAPPPHVAAPPPYAVAPPPHSVAPPPYFYGPAALLRGPAALLSGPAALLSQPRRPTPAAPPPCFAAPPPYSCGPTALLLRPRRPTPAALPPYSSGPAALLQRPRRSFAAAPPPYFAAPPLSALAAPPEPPTAVPPCRSTPEPPTATPPWSRTTGPPSSRGAELPCRRAALQPSCPAAHQPSRRAAEPPSSRAAEPPSRPIAEPPEQTCPGRAIDFEVWVDDLQLFLQCHRADGLSLFDLTFGASPAPATDADPTVRSQWATHDAAERLAVSHHLPTTERAHFSQYKSAQTLYDAVVARYSSLATTALSRLMLPYLFPDLAAFPTVADLITHLRTSDTRYRAALPTEFCAKTPPPKYITLYYIVTRLPDSLRVVRDHFLSVCPTTLTVALLEKALLAVEKSIVTVGASRGDPRTPIFEGRSVRRLPLAGDAALARARGARARVELAGVVEVAVEAVEGVGVAVGVVAGVVVVVAAAEAEAAAAVVVGAEAEVVAEVEAAVAEEVELVGVVPRSGAALVVVSATAAAAAAFSGHPPSSAAPAGVAMFDLDFDAILAAMYVVTISDEGDCYLCFPPDPGIGTPALGACEAAALGSSTSAPLGTGEAALSGTASASASLTFTLDSGASRSFFRDRTTLTPLGRPVAVSLADPSGGPVLSHFSTVLPCPAAPSGTLSGLYQPSFSTNLVSGADLQDAGVHQFTPASLRVTHFSDARTGRHLATFSCRPGSSLYTLTTESPPVTVSGQVAASGEVFAAASRSGPESAPCSCRLLSHETLLWHYRLGHPSLPRLRGMASRVLVSGLPQSLPPLPSGPGPSCVPCVEGRLRASPHSSQFPPTEAPLQTLYMDVWGPAHVRGQGHERYFLLVVDDYSRYTAVFPLRSKGDVTEVLIDWIRAARLQLRRSFGLDFPVLRLHSDRGGEFSSCLLQAFCRARGIHQTFTLLDSPQQNGIAERRIGMVMDVARTSMMHATAPHFLWPFAVRYAAHQINLHPRVSRLETSPALLWTGQVGDASAFRVWGSRAFVRDLSVDKLSPRPPPVDPLPPQGPTPSGVSQVDAVEPVEVAGESGTAAGAEPGGADSGGAARVGAEPGGADSRGAARVGAEPRGADSGGPARMGAEPGGAEPGGTTTGGAEPGGATLGAPEPGGAASGATEPGGAGPAAAGPPLVASGGAGPGGSPGASSRQEPLSPQELREWFARRWRRTAGVGASSAAEGAGDAGPGAAGPADLTRAGAAEGVGAEAAAVRPGGGPAAGIAGGSRPASPVRAARASGRGSRQLPPPVPRTHRMSLRTSTAPLRAPLSSPPESSLPALADPESDSLRAASPTVTRLLATVVTDPSFESTAASALVAELVEFAARCRLEYAACLVAESASVYPPSVGGTYVDAVPPPRANIVSGMWIFRVKRLPGSPTVFKARYVACGFSQRQGVDYFQTFSPTPKMTTLRVLLHIAAHRDYELHSLDFSTAFLQDSLHEEIWLRRPPGFTGTFPPGTHDTSLPPFYILVYVDDLIFATADTAGLAHVKSELQKRHTCEAEIYAGAMAAQELRWLTYLLTDLGEPPRSPPVLYVDNKAMLALCREQRLEHRMKHIALRYFLARELQQHGQLRLAYVASEANSADVFTKALPPCDHQRFCTQLGLVPVLPHLLTS